MRGCFLLAILMLSGSSLAHTSVKAIRPAAHAAVTTPKNVEITFNEAIDLHFATFKVYPLSLQGDKLTLNRAAAALSKTALSAKNDQAERVDSFNQRVGTATKVIVPLKPNIPAGTYVFMWRVLSPDGHIITGQSVFVVK